MTADWIQHFHFIRPYWLWALLPLGLSILWLLRRQRTSMSWKHVCDEALLPHVLTQAGGARNRLPLWLGSLAGVLAIIAVAGPAWEQLPQPVFRDQSALVIALDMSQSMDAADVKPSRLSRARLKILDILKLRGTGQTALLVYAADAFVVAPLTDDSDTIAHLVPTLETSIMPAQGSNSLSALDKAQQLLQQASVNDGHIILLTDGISASQLAGLPDAMRDNHRLSVIGFGTDAGSPIPMTGGFLTDMDGSIVIPVLQRDLLRKAAAAGGGLYRDMQNDDSDIEAILASLSADVNLQDAQQDLSADSWREEGPWLLLIALPLVALLARRGWLGVMLIVLIPMPQDAYAFELNDLWRTPDQRAMQAYQQGNTSEAANTFEDPRWRSSALYRDGQYQQALDTLQQPVSSDDHYNRANALAKLGQLEAALKSYDRALELDADNEDAAWNRQLVEQALKQQQQQQDQQQQDEGEDSDSEESQQSDNSDSSAQQSEQDQQQSAQDQQQDEQQASQQQDESSQQDQMSEAEQQQRQDDAEQQSETQQARAQEQEQNEDEQPLSEQALEQQPPDEQDRAMEQWLQRIPDDPGGLLRRKFQYQYKRRGDHTRESQPW